MGRLGKAQLIAFAPTFDQSRAYFGTRLKVSLQAREKVEARCPFHRDKKPSLSIDLKAGTWFCHACNFGGGIIDFERRLTGKEVSDCWMAINASIGREDGEAVKAKRRIINSYDYHDATGQMVFQAVRYEPKGFSQRRPNGKGGWIHNMNGVTRVPFHLPAVVRSNVAIITEGEKDANEVLEAATAFPNEDGKLSYATSTNIGGAGKWQDDFSPYFTGKKVFGLRTMMRLGGNTRSKFAPARRNTLRPCISSNYPDSLSTETFPIILKHIHHRSCLHYCNRLLSGPRRFPRRSTEMEPASSWSSLGNCSHGPKRKLTTW